MVEKKPQIILALPAFSSYSFPVNHYHTMQRTPFTTETPIGAETNKGIFTGFDAAGFAHFLKDGRKGWAGPETFIFIQVIA